MCHHCRCVSFIFMLKCFAVSWPVYYELINFALCVVVSAYASIIGGTVDDFIKWRVQDTGCAQHDNCH